MIALSESVHVRQYGPYSYFFNCVNHAELLLTESEPFVRALSRPPADRLEIIKMIQREFDAPDDMLPEITRDFDEFLAPLLETGMVISGNGPDDFSRLQTRFSYKPLETGESPSEKGSNDSLKPAHDSPKNILNEYFRQHPTPFELDMDLTQSCTERCVHCYVPEYRNALPREKVFAVLDEFAEMGGLKVKFSGGECMMHPDFEDILRYAAKRDLVISVLSNLTLCDDRKIQVLKECNIYLLQTSLYGITEQTHESVTRLPGSFRKTTGAIEALCRADVPVQIMCPLLRENKMEIEGVRDYARRHGMKFDTTFSLLAKADHDLENLEHSLPVEECAEYMRQLGYLPTELHDAPPAGENDYVCEAGIVKIELNSNGNYYPCNGCYNYVLGSCYTQTLREVWENSPGLRQLRELRYKDLPQCRTCRNRYLCKVCPAGFFNETGNLLTPSLGQCRFAECKRKIIEQGKTI